MAIVRPFVVFLWIPYILCPMIEMVLGHGTFLQDASSSNVIDSEFGIINQEGIQPDWEPTLNDPDPKGEPYELPGEPLPALKRNKRILFGTHFLHPTLSYLTYPVIRWFVTISNAHQCSFRMMERFFHEHRSIEIELATEEPTANCVQPYDNPRCGGAMIAPHIVQTACHCLASFWDFDNDTKKLDPKVKNVWEDHNLIFRPGTNEKINAESSDDWWMKHRQEYLATTSLGSVTHEQFLFSKKYYVHSFCKHIGKKIYSNDYGLIFLSTLTLRIPPYVKLYNEKEVPPPKFLIEQKNVAPVMTEKQMELTWALEKRHLATCLFLGTGWEKWESGIYEELPVPGLIKYTWRSLASYSWCANFFKYILDMDPHNETLWKHQFQCEKGYQECATWECTLQTGRIYGIPALGDDGGPVVCDGNYLGTIGTSYPPNHLPFSYVVIIHGNVHSIQSLAEYRVALLLLEAGSPAYGTGDIPVDPDTGGIFDDEVQLFSGPLRTSRPRRSSASGITRALPTISSLASTFCAFILVNRSVHSL